MTRLAALLALLCLPLSARADILPRIAPDPAPVRYGNDALARIEAAHHLNCGIVTAAEDYSMASTHGDLAKFGTDLCRATAAAVLGNANAITLNGYPDDAHGTRALHTGKVDVLFGLTPDAASALPYGLSFAPTAFFDGQGFMVNRTAGITRPEQLAGKLLCFITGTSQEARMLAWGATSGTKYFAHDFQERGEMDAALVSGSCAAITDDVSALAQMRAGFHGRTGDFVILPQLIAIDPWAPALRAGDVRLSAVITDVMAVLVTAEAQHITAQTVAQPHPAAAALFGPTPGIVATLGMPDGWAARAIQAVGNYGEVFGRDLGAKSPYNLQRGPDALWSDGGMLAPPTLR